MSLRLRLPAGCVQRCRICDRPPHNSRRVRNAQIIFARSKKGKKKEQNRAEPFGGFFRCPRRVPPPQQQPGANVLLGVLWPADRGVVLKVCEGRKEEKKRSSHLDFDKFRAGQQQLPGKDIAGGKSGFSRDVGLPG